MSHQCRIKLKWKVEQAKRISPPVSHNDIYELISSLLANFVFTAMHPAAPAPPPPPPVLGPTEGLVRPRSDCVPRILHIVDIVDLRLDQSFNLYSFNEQT
jgi:hypothetical protein